MKTVIHTWVNNHFGLGDLIRGTIKLYQLSKKLNFTYIVDIQHHPICNFLKIQHHGFSDFIKENRKNIVCKHNIEEYINNSQDKLLYFVTNDGYKDLESITEDCKIFIKKLLTPNEEFSDYIENKMKFYNLENYKYDILHFRLGDDAGLIEGDINSEKFRKLLHKIDNFLDNKTQENSNVLISDNIKFREFVKELRSSEFNNSKEKYKNIITFNVDVAHLGHHNHIDKIRDTVFEFFVLTKSKSINTYSVYEWISGFVFWVHQIYDISLIKI
jgi:hypothetical protein